MAGRRRLQLDVSSSFEDDIEFLKAAFDLSGANDVLRECVEITMSLMTQVLQGRLVFVGDDAASAREIFITKFEAAKRRQQRAAVASPSQGED